MSNMFEVDDDAVRTLVALAKEGESVDPINWGNLNISEDEAYVNRRIDHCQTISRKFCFKFKTNGQKIT
jgi:hypothetical protein